MKTLNKYLLSTSLIIMFGANKGYSTNYLEMPVEAHPLSSQRPIDAFNLEEGDYKKTQEMYKFFKSILKKNESNNKSIVYYKNNDLNKIIATFLTRKFYSLDINLESKKKVIISILKDCDFRILGDYIHAILNKDCDLIRSIEYAPSDMKELFKVNYARFQRLFPHFQGFSKPLQKVSNLLEVLNEATPHKNLAYLGEIETGKHMLERLAEISKGHIGDFIESHYDLPGFNSLVRKGLIKLILLPEGTHVISKKNNPDKKGRFALEQQNLERLKEILDLKTSEDYIFLGTDALKREVRLKLVRPFAIISEPSQERFYSLSLYQPGKTLEETLLEADSILTRSFHLGNMESILELLYAKGIIWGDMAPRNIIVEENENCVTYHLLDFEKTKILDRPVAEEEKEEHCRGPMCVEEFGAIATQREVKKYFKYFTPDKWDLTSSTPLPFEKPKRELEAIFKGRGKDIYSYGEYNQLEKQLLKIRFPYLEQREKKFPLHVSFKVDHYLGADYDRKTTEIFMLARQAGLFMEVIEILEDALKNLENNLLWSDLNAACNTQYFSSKDIDIFEKNILKGIIDELYNSSSSQEELSATCGRHRIRLDFYNARTNNLLNINGLKLSNQNYELISKKLEPILQTISENYSPNILFVSGGYARHEITYGSDLDVGVVAKDNIDEIKSAIETQVKRTIGLEVEFYPLLSLESLEERFKDSPDFYLDLYYMKIISGKEKELKNYKESISSILYSNHNKNLAIDAYIASLENNSADLLPQLKKVLEGINLLLALNEGNIQLLPISLRAAKKTLLFFKNEFYVSDLSQITYLKLLMDNARALIVEELEKIKKKKANL